MRAIFGNAYIVILSQPLILNVICRLRDQMHHLLVLPMNLPLGALKRTQQESCAPLPSYNRPSSRPQADTYSRLRRLAHLTPANFLVISTHPSMEAPRGTHTNTRFATCHFHKDAGICQTCGLCGIIRDRTRKRVLS